MARRMGKYKKINDSNFYQLGSLLTVDVRKYGGTSAFSEQLAEDVFKDDADVLRGVQELLLPEDKALLDAYQQIKNQAHSFVFKNSIPHELPTFYYILDRDKEQVEQGLQELQKQAREIAEQFADKFGEAEKKFAKEKPTLYRPEKYPRKADLLSRFVFRWKWKRIMPSDANSDELKQEIAEMKRYVLQAMKKTLLDRMTALEKACTDGSNITSATLDSINNQVFEKYEKLFAGFIDNADIEGAIADLKEYLDGTDAEMLRVDDAFKALVAEKAQSVAKTVKAVKTPKSGRALIF